MHERNLLIDEIRLEINEFIRNLVDTKKAARKASPLKYCKQDHTKEIRDFEIPDV